MTDTPTPKRAVLAIDPGITTGWTLQKYPAGTLVGTSVWGTAELVESLDKLIRAVYSEGYTLDVVIELMPPSVFGKLATKLEAVRRDIFGVVVETYDIPVTLIAPGTWKPSRVAKTMKLPWKFDDTPMMIHQKDALRMGAYFIDQKKRHNGKYKEDAT